jgi:hypothetical protein
VRSGKPSSQKTGGNTKQKRPRYSTASTVICTLVFVVNVSSLKKILTYYTATLFFQDKERYVKEKEEYRLQRVANGEEEDKPTRRKSSKKGGDPNAPKKPLSSYIIFSGAMRAEVKEANPDASTTDLSKLLGVKWQALSDEDKATYVDQAKDAKDKYVVDLEKYYEENPEAKAAAEAAKVSGKGKGKQKKTDGAAAKGQKTMDDYKSEAILHSSDDVDSDNEDAIEAMLAKATTE